ncbi:hypothetical protein SSCG_01936 [Streptomyces clavuligerus]|nr:hypothetical protein SSCG_01936 [Streptomyces clavuligerus]
MPEKDAALVAVKPVITCRRDAMEAVEEVRRAVESAPCTRGTAERSI